MGDDPTAIPGPDASDPTTPDADAPVVPPAAAAPTPPPVVDVPVAPTPVPPAAPATDAVTAKLVELGVDVTTANAVKGSLGVTTLDDLAVLTVDDYLAAGVKPVQARKLVTEFAPAATAAADAAVSAAAVNLLPRPMDNTSWMTALKTSGVLKVGEVAYISATRAAIAAAVDLFGVPKRIVDAMEERAQVAEEPFGEEYYTLRNQVTRTDYGDLFSAIPGITGSYVTKARKDLLIERIRRSLWPALADFNTQLQSWNDKWMQASMNPAIMQNMILRASTGMGGPMPAGLMAAPDTSPLRDYSEEVTNTINKVFAGDGPVIASAMAVEAAQIRDSLSDPRLPAAVGETTRELMLKKLGIDVGPADTRLEQDVTTFVLATVQLKDQPSGDTELAYIGALWQLGSQIPWDRLLRGASGTNLVPSLGGRRKLDTDR